MANIINATLNLWIYTGDFGSKDASKPDYIIYKEKKSSEDIIFFEIGELVRDYTEVLFSGDYSTIQQSAWVEWQMIRAYDDATTDETLIGSAISFNGYGYFEDGVNPQLSSDVLISNTNIFHKCPESISSETVTADSTLYKADNSLITADNASSSAAETAGLGLYIPLLAGEEGATEVTYLDYSGSVISTVSVGGGSFTPLTVDNIDHTADSDLLTSDMTYIKDESSEITEEVAVPFGTRTIRILLADGSYKTLYVKCIDCSKYEPYKISFVNKFGVVQDLWFDKKRTDNLDVSKDSYKRNILNISAAGVTYSTNTASMFPHNIIGNKNLIMNTGFVTEDYNEVIQQLMLTESAWIHEDGLVTPIVPKTRSFKYKTTTDEKLINFTVEFDYAFETINNIR
jgi:hypothetical protein